ncbi:hypothetical protein EW145_g4504 [Phellinidium pouzarii]|uniref:Exonuclease domain-containing protein n=1 Tax=Phellinidium pouzarii TaxID=167371 RepID=A0A4S4L3G9_9AGAM|nr:hypothetical protein EW145_g4504 [Phellinidium pouzarii]
MKRALGTDSSLLSSSVQRAAKRLKSSPSLESIGREMSTNGTTDRTTEKRKATSSPRLDPTPLSNAFESSFPEKEGEDSGDWLKVEKRKAKKARKTEERFNNVPPKFFYVNSEIVKRKSAIGIGEIRDLVLHLLGEAGPQPWLKVEVNLQMLREISVHLIPIRTDLASKKVVVLFVPGILPEHLNVDVQPVNATTNPYLPVSIPLPSGSSTSFQPHLQQPGPTVVKTLFGMTKEIISHARVEPSVSTKLPFVSRTFSHACPTRAPGDALRMHSVLSAFFQGPINADERRRRVAASLKGTFYFCKDKDVDATNPLNYVLTPAQMRENDYPLPSYMRDVSEGLDLSMGGEDWEETPNVEDEKTASDSRPVEVFAADCEMCLTEDGKALTRISVVSYASGEVLLDELVKPPKPITDYLTKWSGITEEALRPVTTPLTTARSALIELLAASRARTGHTPILLGHSLENDLQALRLMHPRIIDTAILYHHPSGRPRKPGLAWLTKKWCGRIEGGPGFGENKNAIENESVWERLRRSVRGSATGEPGSGEGALLKTAIVDHGNAAFHGAGAGRTVACVSDEEVVQGVLKCVEECDFVWARLSGLAEAQGWIHQKSSVTASEAIDADNEHDETRISAAFTALNAHLALVHAALPESTALVLFTGHGDPRNMSTLQARRAAFESAIRSTAGAAGAEQDVSGLPADLTTVLVIDYILLMRVVALYSGNRKLARCLRLLFGLEAAFDLGVLMNGRLYGRLIIGGLAKGVTACTSSRSPSSVWPPLSWAFPLAYGLILMGLALYKAAVFWKESAGLSGLILVKILIQDQAIYFIMVIFCTVAQITSDITELSTFLSNLLEIIGSPTLLCILGSRLLIHMKEAGERGVNEGTSYMMQTMSDIAFS